MRFNEKPLYKTANPNKSSSGNFHQVICKLHIKNLNINSTYYAALFQVYRLLLYQSTFINSSAHVCAIYVRVFV